MKSWRALCAPDAQALNILRSLSWQVCFVGWLGMFVDAKPGFVTNVYSRQMDKVNKYKNIPR